MTTKPPTLNDLVAATAEAERIIERRDSLIVQLALLGEERADLCEASGLSDDRVRVIERAGGVPPRRRGRPRKTA